MESKDDYAAEPSYAAVHASSGLVIATHVRVAGTSAQRRRGLTGVSGLAAGEGLWIAPCEAVHTFGMRMCIDVLFLDRERRVRKVVRSLPPRRISLSLVSYSALELAAGVIDRTGTRVGDSLRFSPTAEH